MIKVGDALPACTLMEYAEVEGDGLQRGPQPRGPWHRPQRAKRLPCLLCLARSRPPARPGMCRATVDQAECVQGCRCG